MSHNSITLKEELLKHVWLSLGRNFCLWKAKKLKMGIEIIVVIQVKGLIQTQVGNSHYALHINFFVSRDDIITRWKPLTR